MEGMAVSMHKRLLQELGELRYVPTGKRIRARSRDRVVADSLDAVLVWEPRRVVPVYAVPIRDVQGTLSPAPGGGGAQMPVFLDEQAGPPLGPGVGFAAHTCHGTALDIVTDDAVYPAAAFRPADEVLSTLVLLDFEAFDWWEEDEQILGHPRDPFHRVDVRRSSRRVRVELEGLLLAESDRPSAVFETLLPVTRFYLPREDVRVPLVPTETRTYCAYKGEASYFTVESAGERGIDVAWSYEHPLPDCPEIAGLVAFFQERLDVTVDGAPMVGARTPWSEPA
ncbi:Uncharacterized conserved protein, DUF427 family [Rhodococcus maanshanensis]|uniref:Uncharacterized conserved protein, DUF427 family n=2 Tax=Rhodococcus maanshanensis TaxID=183556 RepID=A0A1H7F6A0_9NOCA|nr:Uncharacterized conserved protein, DUF427 family [Rhodococcus maanshanensis]